MRSFALRYSVFGIRSFPAYPKQHWQRDVDERGFDQPPDLNRPFGLDPRAVICFPIARRTCRDRQTVTDNSWDGVGALGREAEP
jgi:hypothetical protein